MAKASKRKAHYRIGTRSRHCALCTMFVAPDDCTAVEKGKNGISPHGLCDYYAARSESRSKRWYGEKG